jgi:hypothetical protein
LTGSLPCLRTGIDTHIQKAQKTSSRINPKRATPRNIIIKLVKAKDKRKY